MRDQSVKKRERHWMNQWARDSSLLTISQVTALVVTTGLAALVARYLGPDEFGIFAGFLSLAYGLSLYVDAGVATWLLRELSRSASVNKARSANESRAADSELVCAALTFNGALALVLTAGSIVVAAALGSSQNLVLSLAALMAYSCLLNCAATLETVFRARRMIGTVIAAIACEKGLLVALVGAALLAGWGIMGIALGYVAAGLARVVFDVGASMRGLIKPRAPEWQDLRKVFLHSLPFGISSTASTAVVRLDTFVLGLFSVFAAGLYAIGDRFATAALIVPATAATTLYPLLARRERALRGALHAAVTMGAIGALLAGIGIAVAPWLVPALFGDRFSGAVDVVQLMLLGVPFYFATSMLMAGLFSAGHERSVVRVLLPSTIFGTGCVILGQLTEGVRGAAIGYACRPVLQLVALSALAWLVAVRQGGVNRRLPLALSRPQPDPAAGTLNELPPP
jgi:O-antigen/teichoic acid export membrane protein